MIGIVVVLHDFNASKFSWAKALERISVYHNRIVLYQVIVAISTPVRAVIPDTKHNNCLALGKIKSLEHCCIGYDLRTCLIILF
ncbi:hypothetical protein GDO86_005238 [Hymenochirus boettgeri]|uniref:Uncharacterized protein n=1 Tax=Hymenochirus boettgeri TaxID=247094 RepID=A0A8T2J953_9PIPI|nr:hypothetical protein GDO86_005238 [Hymenochirus boettgeri]